MEAKRVINGKWGEVWIDQEKIGECYGFQAKISFKKEDIQMCGQMGSDKKITGWDGTGSIRMHKVNSRMASKLLRLILEGKDVRFTVIGKLADPDAYGNERVAIKNVSFDDLTLQDWEANQPGKTEAPFTFSNLEYLDNIPTV